MKRTYPRSVLCLVFAGTLLAYIPMAGPTRLAMAEVADQGAEAAESEFDDRWLIDATYRQLRDCLESGEYDTLRERLDSAVLARLCYGQLDELDALNVMLFGIRACEYLSLAEELTGDKKRAEWLLEHTEVSRLLFRAIADGAKPSYALENIKELIDADEKAVLAYPNLSVAFATASPLRYYVEQPNASTMIEAFKWYTRSKVRFRYDLKTMPYELSRYLADTRLSLAERKWAATKYRRHYKPPRAYFDLRYDRDFYLKGEPKRIASLEFTLPNLRKVGGVCIEQAYYAAEVCKALGIPATIVVGRGSSGIGHAWVAALEMKRSGKSAYWDCDTGRYREHLYFKGSVNDPAGGGRILDSELMLAGGAAHLPLRRREEADLAATLANNVNKARKSGAVADFGAIKALAEQYNASIAEDKDVKPVELGDIQPSGKLDLELVEKLLHLAIKRNLAHKPAWELIIKMRKADEIPVDHLDTFFDVLVGRTSKEYPDYSCVMVMRIVPTVDDPARRQKVYQRAMQVYGRRPDLQGRILISAGDDYQDEGKLAKAFKFYEQASVKCIGVAEIVLEASVRAEKLLLDADGLDHAIRFYQKLFPMARRYRNRSAFRASSSYYQLGTRLALLLEQAGRTKAADKIREKIDR